MSGALTKRQQARNEKALQELVHIVPGNNFCADCQARNPAWASWSLGIFLCMRCAAIHRKLGTHVSKVKSLSMDSWSNEQVENMKKVGNLTSNKLYNPRSKNPPVPIDADEADSAMERFIRQKYMNNTSTQATTRRHDTGSTESDDTPPPLPPKTPGRFGFRSASSIFPLSSKAKKEAAARAPPSPRDLARHSPTSPRRNKASQVFGASVQYDGSGADTDRKLGQLRDMGFNDDQRNALVLKGVHGNLERAVESLVRLGEGGGRSPISLTSPRESSLSATRSLTPATTASGLSVPQRQSKPAPSNNPFDMLDMPPAQPQSSQSTGTLQTKNPYNNNPYNVTNPFGAPAAQSNDTFNMAFQNMSLAPSQPLFPHHTGGIPAPQLAQQPLYQQTMTPAMPNMTQNYTPVGFNSNQTYPQMVQPTPTGYNPFLNMQSQPPAQPQPQLEQQQQPLLSVNTAGMGHFGNNPFTRSPTRIQSPPLGQIPEQTQQTIFSSQQAQPQPWISAQQLQQPQPFGSMQPQLQANNPFLSQSAPMPQQMPQQQQPQQQQNPYLFQPQRANTASIMALYNMPQLAPQPFQPQPQADASHDAVTAMFGAAPPPLQQQQQQQQQAVGPAPDAQTRSISSPLPGNKNPFFSSAMPAAQAGAMDPFGGSSRSRDSVMALGMEWSNGGRHSPDAFASLSARH